jgi:ABC-type sugar transport system ATPase subunit
LEEHINPHVPVEQLGVAQQQIVEIARALSHRSRILAMDEPTASLTDAEKNNLFALIRRLKKEGSGILYVSHRLEEVFEVADRVTVLRDGKVVASCVVTETDRQQLIRWMVGRELEQHYPYEERARGKEMLRVEQISTDRLHDVSLTLCRDEIVGLAGLVGAGRTEFVRAIFGADPVRQGRMLLNGTELKPRSPREAIRAGIGLLTEDRNNLGLILQMNVAQNITLANLTAVVQRGFVNTKNERATALTFIERLRIKPPYPDAAVSTLSGGNRQKVILARWLFTDAKVLMFDEPTAGVDVGVKYDIYKTMNELARQGIGIIVVSSDLPELIGICDRIVVMCNGRITGELSRAEATQETIMALATAFNR